MIKLNIKISFSNLKFVFRPLATGQANQANAWGPKLREAPRLDNYNKAFHKMPTLGGCPVYCTWGPLSTLDGPGCN